MNKFKYFLKFNLDTKLMIDMRNKTVNVIGKTNRNDDNSETMVIPKQFTQKLGFENSKVTVTLVENYYGDKCLVVAKLFEVIHDALE